MEEIEDILELEKERKETQKDIRRSTENILVVDYLHEHIKSLRRECKRLSKEIDEELGDFLYKITDNNHTVVDKKITIRDGGVYIYDNSKRAPATKVSKMNNLCDSLSTDEDESEHLENILKELREKEELINKNFGFITENDEITVKVKATRLQVDYSRSDTTECLSMDNDTDWTRIDTMQEEIIPILSKTVEKALRTKEQLQETLISVKKAKIGGIDG